MCGRYTLNGTPDEVANYFGCEVRDNFPARYNIAPTQPVGVIRMPESGRDYAQKHYHLLRWGFIPEWAGRAKNPEFIQRPLINARSETVLQKPTFRNAFKRRRCLVPANGFYEWKTIKGEKKPFYCQPRAGGLIAFAGIWETILDPGGGEMDTGAILTTSAGMDLKIVHHREPVIIAQKDFRSWLSADERDVERLFSMLTARENDFWKVYPVAKDVGNVRNDGANLTQMVATNDVSVNLQQGQLF